MFLKSVKMFLYRVKMFSKLNKNVSKSKNVF